MGNVQCCASGRFHQGKLPKKPKKSKKKELKANSATTNGVGGGKNGGLKVSAVAEDATEHAAPAAEKQAQGTAPAAESASETVPPAADVNKSADQQHNKNISAARERFFGQVRVLTPKETLVELLQASRDLRDGIYIITQPLAPVGPASRQKIMPSHLIRNLIVLFTEASHELTSNQTERSCCVETHNIFTKTTLYCRCDYVSSRFVLFEFLHPL